MRDTSSNIDQQPTRIIRIDEVSARTGLCASSIYNLIAAGEFPRQIKLTGRAVGWIEAEIDGWIAQKAAQRPSSRAI